MLFITNRTPRESIRSQEGRSISFDNQNTTISQYIYFCERNSENDYTERTSQPFFQKLKTELDKDTQLLFYIHGFNNNMEPTVFQNAEKLQKLINDIKTNSVCVIPIIWPCDDDSALLFLDDYWDDQDAAEYSGASFARLLGKFDDWRRSDEQQRLPCTRRMNIIAHSMGNFLLEQSLKKWAEKHSAGNMPQIFRNIFMIAADVKNQTLEKGEDGQYIVDAARNVVIYYANDDLAMPASKVANIKSYTLSRRMGMTGPEKLKKLPKKVYEVDCDEFNGKFDLKGHTYFLQDNEGNSSPIVKHMFNAIDSGRVFPDNRSIVLK